MAGCLTLQLVKMKLQTQLLIMISILFALIITFLITLHATQFKLLNSQLQKSSDIIFKQNSLKLQSNVINWQKSYLHKVFFLNGNSLITLHRLYHVTKNQVVQGSLEENTNYQMNYAGTTQIPDPIRIINGYGNNDLSYSFNCYSNLSDFENPKTIDEKLGIKLQEQFQSYGQILYSGGIIKQIFFQNFVKKEKIYTIYPCLNRREDIYGFHGEQRDWYIELKRNYDSKQLYISYNYTFTKPWLRYTLKKIGLSIVMPLVDKELNLIGGLSVSIMGKELVQNLKESNFGFHVIYLVSDEGMMIMHPYQTAESILEFYIYNETITGFNMTDWLQILSKTGESSCPIFAKYQSSLKCRYNSLYKQEMIVGSYVFEEFKLILIMLQSSQEYVQFYNKFQNNLESDLQLELCKLISLQVGIFLVLSSILYKIIDIIFIPIKFVKAEALNMISKKKYQKANLSKISMFFAANEIQEIFQSFELLKNKFDLLSLQKTSQCQEIEQYQFPEKYLNLKFNIQYYINKLGKRISKVQQEQKTKVKLKLKFILQFLKLSFRNVTK